MLFFLYTYAAVQLCSYAVLQSHSGRVTTIMAFIVPHFVLLRVMSSCPEQSNKETINIYLHYDIITIFYYLYLVGGAAAITVHLYYKKSV